MKKEDVEFFVDKKVKLVCIVQGKHDNVTLTYTGLVLSVSDDTLTIRDKFDKVVAISLDGLKQIGEHDEEDR